MSQVKQASSAGSGDAFGRTARQGVRAGDSAWQATGPIAPSTPSVRAIDSYRAIDIQSRTPLELIVMLYDGALRFMREARTAIERRDIPARRRAISRALAVVSELQNTLDLESGASLAESLDGLYTFVIERLTEASVKHEVRSIDEATHVIATLREGWAGIASRTEPAGRHTR